MVILALDLAEKCGWCVGAAGSLPESGSVRLIKSGAPVKDLPAAGAAFVRRLIKTYEPSLIVREAPLPPRFNGFSNTKTFVSQHFLHGAVIAIAGFYGVGDVDVDVTTWRKFFLWPVYREPGEQARREEIIPSEDRRPGRE